MSEKEAAIPYSSPVRHRDMILRDWFAGQVAGQVLRNIQENIAIMYKASGKTIQEQINTSSAEATAAIVTKNVAKQAYMIADAMLKAREDS